MSIFGNRYAFLPERSFCSIPILLGRIIRPHGIRGHRCRCKIDAARPSVT